MSEYPRHPTLRGEPSLRYGTLINVCGVSHKFRAVVINPTFNRDRCEVVSLEDDGIWHPLWEVCEMAREPWLVRVARWLCGERQWTSSRKY